MPVETLTDVPAQITAGTTARFTLSYADYPASAWELEFVILGSGSLSEAATASGDDFAIVLTAEETATLTPGQYNWAARVTETATEDVTIAASGVLTVLPNLAQTTVGPWRTRYNAAVAAQAAIVADQFSTIQIEGQSFTRHNLDSLQKAIDWLEGKAIGEDKTLGRGTAGGLKRIQMRF